MNQKQQIVPNHFSSLSSSLVTISNSLISFSDSSDIDECNLDKIPFFDSTTVSCEFSSFDFSNSSNFRSDGSIVREGNLKKSFVKGIMNLRGLIIPVIDVKDKLGFGSTDLSKESKQRILVAEVKDSLYGLLVDDVDQVMRIPSKEIGPAPPGAFEALNYVKGIAKTSDKLIVLLDVLPLISDEENEAKDIRKKSDIPSEIKQNPPPKISESIPEEPKIETKSSNDEEVDDIPPELKAVFDEDENGIAPTEIIREEESDDSSSSFDAPEDFQSLVDNESNN